MRSFTIFIPFVAGLSLALSGCNAGEENKPNGSTTISVPSRPITPTATPAEQAVPSLIPLGNVSTVTEVGFFLLEPATGLLWQIDSSPAGSILWSSRGESLIRFGPGRDVDVIDPTANSIQRIFSGEFWHLDWSPDGSRLALSTKDGIFTVRRDGSDLTLLAAVDGRAGMGWSPRGDLIASAERYEVRLTEVATGESRVVSPEVGPDDLLGLSGWLPDGSGLLLCASQASEPKDSRLSPGTYVYDLISGTTRKLADTCGLSVSSDGKSYTYSDPAGIFIAKIDGSQPPQLIVTDAESGARSPDGAWFAFGKDDCSTRDWDIYAVSADGSTTVKLTDSPTVLKESAGWSPVANEIAYSAVLDDSQALVAIGVEDLVPRTLLTSPRTNHIHGPRWSPDGRYISFSAGSGHGAC